MSMIKTDKTKQKTKKPKDSIFSKVEKYVPEKTGKPQGWSWNQRIKKLCNPSYKNWKQPKYPSLWDSTNLKLTKWDFKISGYSPTPFIASCMYIHWGMSEGCSWKRYQWCPQDGGISRDFYALLSTRLCVQIFSNKHRSF